MRSFVLLSGVLCVGLVAPGVHAVEAVDPGAVFSRRCNSCHTFGKGDLVGPDLKGVTERRPRIWLLRFIQSSESVIRSGDATALWLFRKYKQQRMPDHNLSTQQIQGLLDYLAASGPEAEPAGERRAESATPAEVEMGRRLFDGSVGLASGGASCLSCHSIEGDGARGGSLAPDLTGAYAKYRDEGLHSFVDHPCFPRASGAARAQSPTLEEAFALKAYLRRTSLKQASAVVTTSKVSGNTNANVAAGKEKR